MYLKNGPTRRLNIYDVGHFPALSCVLTAGCVRSCDHGMTPSLRSIDGGPPLSSLLSPLSFLLSPLSFLNSPLEHENEQLWNEKLPHQSILTNKCPLLRR